MDSSNFKDGPSPSYKFCGGQDKINTVRYLCHIYTHIFLLEIRYMHFLFIQNDCFASMNDEKVVEEFFMLREWKMKVKKRLYCIYWFVFNFKNNVIF